MAERTGRLGYGTGKVEREFVPAGAARGRLRSAFLRLLLQAMGRLRNVPPCSRFDRNHVHHLRHVQSGRQDAGRQHGTGGVEKRTVHPAGCGRSAPIAGAGRRALPDA
ncbi:hypothetical protein D1872_290100 [compost metagenome]